MPDHTRPLWADLPHGDAINALLDELRDLTDDEARAIDAAWNAAMDAALDAELDDVLDAALGAPGAPGDPGDPWTAVMGAALGAGRGAPWSATSESAWGSAQYAAQDAARALVVADLVGQYGLTRDHLDTLAAPARTIPRLSAIIDRALPGGES